MYIPNYPILLLIIIINICINIRYSNALEAPISNRKYIDIMIGIPHRRYRLAINYDVDRIILKASPHNYAGSRTTNQISPTSVIDYVDMMGLVSRRHILVAQTRQSEYYDIVRQDDSASGVIGLRAGGDTYNYFGDLIIMPSKIYPHSNCSSFKDLIKNGTVMYSYMNMTERYTVVFRPDLEYSRIPYPMYFFNLTSATRNATRSVSYTGMYWMRLYHNPESPEDPFNESRSSSLGWIDLSRIIMYISPMLGTTGDNTLVLGQDYLRSSVVCVSRSVPFGIITSADMAVRNQISYPSDSMLYVVNALESNYLVWMLCIVFSYLPYTIAFVTNNPSWIVEVTEMLLIVSILGNICLYFYGLNVEYTYVHAFHSSDIFGIDTLVLILIIFSVVIYIYLYLSGVAYYSRMAILQGLTSISGYVFASFIIINTGWITLPIALIMLIPIRHIIRSAQFSILFDSKHSMVIVILSVIYISLYYVFILIPSAHSFMNVEIPNWFAIITTTCIFAWVIVNFCFTDELKEFATKRNKPKTN